MPITNLTLETIIAEANARVANTFGDAQKVAWLQEVNSEFFEVVKIPKVVSAAVAASATTFIVSTATANLRGKDIDKLMIDTVLYSSYAFEDVKPGHNYFIFDDGTQTITFSPAPSTTGTLVVRYHLAPTTNFLLASVASQSPDAPSEYHWVYTLGLCERIAKGMDDLGKANNYATDYRAALLIAQQNYRKEG